MNNANRLTRRSAFLLLPSTALALGGCSLLGFGVTGSWMLLPISMCTATARFASHAARHNGLNCGRP